MARVEHGLVRDLHQLVGQRAVELLGVAAGEVRPAAALQEQRVARDQPILDQEALRARRVARRVDHRDRDLPDLQHVAAVVELQVALAAAGLPPDPLGLVALGVHLAGTTRQQLRDAFEVVTEQVAADVVGVVVGRERAGDLHAVGGDQFTELVDGVARVYEHALAGGPVPDRVDEVGHLACDRIGGAEVPPGQPLSKIQTVLKRPWGGVPIHRWQGW